MPNIPTNLIKIKKVFKKNNTNVFALYILLRHHWFKQTWYIEFQQD